MYVCRPDWRRIHHIKSSTVIADSGMIDICIIIIIIELLDGTQYKPCGVGGGAQ